MKYLTFLIILFMAVNPVFADKFYIKGGKVIKGKLVSQDDDSIVVESHGSWQEIPKSDIKMIRRDEEAAPSLRPGTERRRRASGSAGFDSDRTYESFAINRGSFLLSGSLNYSMIKTSYIDTSGNKVNYATTYITTLSPSIGIFVTKGFMLGPAFELSVLRSGGSQIVIGYGLKVAGYLGSKTSVIYPHVGFAYMATSASSDNENIYSGSMVIPNFGINFMVTRKLALTLDFGCKMHTYKYNYYSTYFLVFGNDTYKEDNYYISAGITAFYFK